LTNLEVSEVWSVLTFQNNLIPITDLIKPSGGKRFHTTIEQYNAPNNNEAITTKPTAPVTENLTLSTSDIEQDEEQKKSVTEVEDVNNYHTNSSFYDFLAQQNILATPTVVVLVIVVLVMFVIFVYCRCFKRRSSSDTPKQDQNLRAGQSDVPQTQSNEANPVQSEKQISQQNQPKNRYLQSYDTMNEIAIGIQIRIGTHRARQNFQGQFRQRNVISNAIISIGNIGIINSTASNNENTESNQPLLNRNAS